MRCVMRRRTSRRQYSRSRRIKENGAEIPPQTESAKRILKAECVSTRGDNSEGIFSD